MLEAAKVAKILGGKKTIGRDIESDLSMHEAILRGLPFSVLTHILDQGVVTKNELFHYVISRRTYERRLRDKRLKAEESERVARLSRMVAQARDVFADDRKSHDWLRRPNRSLNGRIPLDLSTTDTGARLVETVLSRAAHGVYS